MFGVHQPCILICNCTFGVWSFFHYHNYIDQSHTIGRAQPNRGGSPFSALQSFIAGVYTTTIGTNIIYLYVSTFITHCDCLFHTETSIELHFILA